MARRATEDATMASGAARIWGFPRPDTRADHRRRIHPGRSANSTARPPSIITMYSNCRVLSAMGLPSLSGYTIAWRDAGGRQRQEA